MKRKTILIIAAVFAVACAGAREIIIEDFADKAGSVEKSVAPYFPEADRKAILSGKLKVKFTDYDWSLNKQ